MKSALAQGPKTATTPKTAATPWGTATLVEELQLSQQAGDKRFASIVQLLETPKGERLVRFAYATDGIARRGPVTLRARDLERLRKALDGAPGLKELLCSSPRCGASRRGQHALDGSVDEPCEQQRAVAGAEQRVDRVLRMGHQPEDVARLVAHARHVADGAVAVLRVAKDELIRRLEARRTTRRPRTSSPRRA